MGFRWVFGSLVVVLALSRRCYASVEGSWCYNDPNCDSDKWLSIGECGGKRQSPIDIITANAVHNNRLGALKLSGYDDEEKLREIKNTGKTVDIELGDGLQLSGSGFPATYTAKSFHLHWGNGASQPGSEHTINGKRYSMELHIVHTKNNMNLQDALKEPEGIAVLAFLIEASDRTDSKTAKAWKSFTENLDKVHRKGKASELDSKVSLSDLMGSPNLGHYYRYHGSLTTPGCNEVVVWTICHDLILVPPEVVKDFPSTLWATDSESGPHLEDNFRPVQKLGDRKVEASFPLSSSKTPNSTASFITPPLTTLFFLSATTLVSFLSV